MTNKSNNSFRTYTKDIGGDNYVYLEAIQISKKLYELNLKQFIYNKDSKIRLGSIFKRANPIIVMRQFVSGCMDLDLAIEHLNKWEMEQDIKKLCLPNKGWDNYKWILPENHYSKIAQSNRIKVQSHGRNRLKKRGLSI